MGHSAVVSSNPAEHTGARRLTLIVPGLMPGASSVDGADGSAATAASSPHEAELGWRQAFDWHPTADEPWECSFYRFCGLSVPRVGALPVARLRWSVDGLNAGATPEHLVCADPVHLQVERDTVSVLPPQALSIRLDEARACAEALDEFLKGDGLEVIVATPEHWYLSGFDPRGLDALPTHAVARRRIDVSLSDGVDAARWRQLTSEVQMLLHDHVVNRERSRRGQRPINSLWFCGGAELAEPTSPTIAACVYSDDPEVHQLASSLGVVCHASSRPVQVEGPVIRVDLSLYKAWLAGDAERLETSRAAVVRTIVRPALEAAQIGQWTSVTAVVGDGVSGVAKPARPSRKAQALVARWLARLRPRKAF